MDVRRKPWRTDVGTTAGLAVGMLFWWSAYEDGGGWLQNVHLPLLSALAGHFVANGRNWWRAVGPYDPEVLARNKGGVV